MALFDNNSINDLSVSVLSWGMLFIYSSVHITGGIFYVQGSEQYFFINIGSNVE